jgi:hypothetical protein
MMGKIGYGYGSEWHMLRYLGYHRNWLNCEILKLTGGRRISWIDHLFSRKHQPLENDRELVGVEFIDHQNVEALWQQYWPQSGQAQNWDAVGQIHFNDRVEWLLVEAKGHRGEVVSSCGARNP